MDQISELVARAAAASLVRGSLKPPPGVKPNFINPETRAPSLINANIAMIVLGTLALIARLYARAFLSRSVGWDDYTAVAALVFNSFFSATTIIQTHVGLGRHQWNVPITWFSPRWMVWNMVMQAMYCPAIASVKAAILLLYLRIFPSSARAFRISTYCVMGFVFAYSFAGFWISIFACHPIRRVWDIKLAQDHSGKSGICVDRNMLSSATASLNMISDLMMLALPVPLVWRLQLPVSQRISILAMFGVACLSIVATMVRLHYSILLKKDQDLTWIQLPPIVWAVIELWAGLICGCIPAMRPLLRYFPAKLFGVVSFSSFNLSRKSRTKGSSGKGSKGSSGLGSGAGKRFDSSGSETGLKFKEGTYLELSEPNRVQTHVHGRGADGGGGGRREAWEREDLESRGDGKESGIAKTVDVNVTRSKIYEL